MQTTITLEDFRKEVIRDEELNQLLSKECKVKVEEGEESIYDNIKALTLEYGGFLKPLTVVVLEGQQHLIDGFTRYQVLEEFYQEGLIEDSFRFNLNVITHKSITKENFVEQAKILMWKLTKASRGSVNDPKLDTIMMGLEYLSAKKSHGGDRLNKQVTQMALGRTAQVLAEKNKDRGWTERKVRSAGELIGNLQTIAAIYNKPDNHFYYLYRSGLPMATISKISKISSDGDIRDVKKIIDGGKISDLATFVSEQIKAARAKEKAEKEQSDRKEWIAEIIPNLPKLSKFYLTNHKLLSKADILKVKSLFRKVKSADLEIITSMVESISSKQSYNNFFSEVYTGYPYLHPDHKTSNKNKHPLASYSGLQSVEQPPEYFEYDHTVDVEEREFEVEKLKRVQRHLEKAYDLLVDCSTTQELQDLIAEGEQKVRDLLGDLDE